MAQQGLLGLWIVQGVQHEIVARKVEGGLGGHSVVFRAHLYGHVAMHEFQPVADKGQVAAFVVKGDEFEVVSGAGVFHQAYPRGFPPR